MREHFVKMSRLYNGFWIEEPVGNNLFSYDNRYNKRIWVPPLIKGSCDDVKIGDKIVFSEIDEGFERNMPGLKNLIYWPEAGADVFIMDNHNHAFFFWVMAIIFGNHPAGLALVHVDMHKDMREPPKYFEGDISSIEDIWEYTNFQLNVGNFIRPALKCGLFSDLFIVDSSMDFEQSLPEKFVLDIDLDIFAPEMDYIDDDYKINKINEWMTRASLITVATSPYFIEPKVAMQKLRELYRI